MRRQFAANIFGLGGRALNMGRALEGPKPPTDFVEQNVRCQGDILRANPFALDPLPQQVIRLASRFLPLPTRRVARRYLALLHEHSHFRAGGNDRPLRSANRSNPQKLCVCLSLWLAIWREGLTRAATCGGRACRGRDELLELQWRFPNFLGFQNISRVIFRYTLNTALQRFCSAVPEALVPPPADEVVTTDVL